MLTKILYTLATQFLSTNNYMNLLSNLPERHNFDMVNKGLSKGFELQPLESDKFYQFICNLLKEVELAYCLGPCLSQDQINYLKRQFRQNVNTLK